MGNGKPIANKPIFVALAQRREVRRAQLEAQHNQRAGQPGQPMMRSSPMARPMGYPSGMPMYMQRPGGSMQQGGRANYTMPAYGNMPQQAGRGGRMTNGRGYGRGRGQGQAQQVRGSGGTGRGGQAGIKFNQQARNAGPAGGAPTQQPPTAPAAQQPPPTPAPAAHEALTAAALASATPEMQKNMIGERLYPLIHNSQPDLAGKITGMLLEMDNSELLHLLESDEALNAKITEALQVLEAHNTDE